jgi:hypothetical protein
LWWWELRELRQLSAITMQLKDSQGHLKDPVDGYGHPGIHVQRT